MNVLEVAGLSVEFRLGQRHVAAVEDVDLTLAGGEILAIVGESGCGKSATALGLIGLIDPRIGRVRARHIRVDGVDLAGRTPADLRLLRRGRLAMVFQEPLTALNPVLRAGDQIAEALPAGLSDPAGRVLALLAEVGIPDPAACAHAYPHELSGGMRQRVVIAMALAQEPKVLIADEATTALDATIQAQILRLLLRLRADRGLSILVITHDFGVVAEIADRVLVFYAGRLVESAPVGRLFDAPAHPYTRALLAARPGPALPPRAELPEIGGTVPPLTAMPRGCRFADRCAQAFARCRAEEPRRRPVGHGQEAACHLVGAAG